MFFLLLVGIYLQSIRSADKPVSGHDNLIKRGMSGFQIHIKVQVIVIRYFEWYAPGFILVARQ